MASTADYIKIAEGIRANEISSKQRIEQLASEISGVVGRINSAEGRIDSLEASISAEMSRPVETDSEGNTYGGPNYAAISSMQAEIGSLQVEISALSAERAQLEGERDTERQHLQEILIEKSTTLNEVQSKARDAAASVASAGGMVGAYSGIGSNLANAFQNAHSNLSRAAGILGGSVGSISAGGGGGGTSGESAAGIRGELSQTRNSASGMTTNGHGGGGRSTSNTSNRSATGASRSMKTMGTSKGGGTAGNYTTSQTSSAGTAFGLGARSGEAAGAGVLNVSKFTTTKTSAGAGGFKPLMDKHLPSDSRGSWSDEKGNSTFSLFDDVEYAIDNNKNVMTGREIREKYGASSVNYNDGEPDFSPFVDDFLGGIHLKEEIPYLRNGNKFEKGTFDIANEKAAMKWAMGKDGLTKEEAQARIGEYKNKVKEYMKENGLTWHECGDLHTILPVPSAINKIFSHTGGISIKLEKQAARNILRERIGARKIRLSKCGKYNANSKELSSAVKGYISELKQEKQRIKDFKVVNSDLFGLNGPSSDPNREIRSYYIRNKIFEDTAPLVKGLEKTRHGFQDCYVNEKESTMYDDPENRTNHKILYNQGKVWDNGPTQTCGQCSCGTIINMLGLNVDEEKVVKYAIRHNLCKPEGYTTPENWVKILRGVGGIESKAQRRVPLNDLASEVEKGKGVIIGVSATRYNPEMYGKYKRGKRDGHALSLISVIREKKSGKILQYVVVDSNNMSPDSAVHFVYAKVLKKAYKKCRSQSVVTEQILR